MADIQSKLVQVNALLDSPTGMVLKQNAPQILSLFKELKSEGQLLQAQIAQLQIDSDNRLAAVSKKIPGAQRNLDDILNQIKELRSQMMVKMADPVFMGNPTNNTILQFAQNQIADLQRMFLLCYQQLLLL